VYSESVQILDKNGAEFNGNTAYRDAWAEFMERRQPKIVTTYRIENADKDYPAGSIHFAIPGIGNALRASIVKAFQLAADENDSEWSYTWDQHV